MAQDWTRMSASDLGRAIGDLAIDPVELTETFLTAIKTHADHDRIYARLTEGRAMAEAKAAALRAKSGTRRSLLDGVPISWKDLYDTAGTETESGSALLKGRVPVRDAAVLAHATAAGLVCLGKTHQTELAFSGLGLNPITATPPNALDPELAPGGSSSGAAVSTALGLAAAGIGSDTGGSVRVPSAWNDLVGLKTTSGLLSLSGVVPLCPRFDTVGPLCRTVEDAAQLTAIMGETRVPDLTRSSLKGKRFLICDSVALDDCDTEVVTGFSQAVAALAEAGAVVDRASLPPVARSMPLSACLFASEAYATWRDEIEANPDAMYPQVRERFRSGDAFSSVEYVRAWQAIEQARVDYLDATAGYDAVILPTCPILPPVTARLLADPEYFTSRNLLALRNTRIGNLMGLCALTIPTGTRHVGITLMGRPMGEAAILRLGTAAEAALGG